MKALSRIPLAVALAAFVSSAGAQPIKTTAPYAILVDYDTQTVLLNQKADAEMAPASMAKLMTLALVFKDIKEGRLSMDDTFVVSEHAWRTGGAPSGGSTMFAALGSSIPVADLLRGVIVQSGNDACIILAEGLAGTEQAFVDRMNRYAEELGLANSEFRNSTGLPHPDQHVTAHDLARLARYIIKEYPDLYKIFAEKEFTWNKHTQRNRNPLLSMSMGADGLKTGHTQESGYGLVASSVRGGQRLILVVNGLDSSRERSEESRKLMDWGFRAFDRILLYPDGETVGAARVYGGSKRYVPLIGDGNISVLVPRGDDADLKGEIVYEGPIPAPIEQGQRVGLFRVYNGEGIVMEKELFAMEDVGVGTLSQRALDAAGELAVSLWREISPFEYAKPDI